MVKRRNWHTSSKRERQKDDSPLNLKKNHFGEEYRKVLDRLLEPKLPDNRELQGDPSYEYAQKAMKLRNVKKIDFLKNNKFIRFLQRKTMLTQIRDMMCIMDEKSKKKFSFLEVDYR